MFGNKIKKVVFSKEYTIESLFEAIKDKPFTAGQPMLVKRAFMYVIVFPELDRQNQVWIMPRGKLTKKFTVQKQEMAGFGNQMANAAIDSATHGVFGMGRMVGSNSKRCQELVEITAEELQKLGL